VVRLIQVFWPSKSKAALRAVLWLAASIPFFLFGQWIWSLVAVVCMIYGLYYSAIWQYKFNRDKQLGDQAKARAMQPPQQVAPSISNPESNLFFVPPEHPAER
jgi:hypothetical protein